jgi:hypothetical protein
MPWIQPDLSDDVPDGQHRAPDAAGIRGTMAVQQEGALGVLGIG